MEKQNNLIDFEKARSGLIKVNNSWIKPAELNPTIPIKESNSFFEVGNGTVQLYTLRDDPNNYRFDIYVDGEVETGLGMFSVNGNIGNISHPYRNFYLRENSTLTVNNNFTVSKGTALINGNVILNSLANFTATEGALVTFSSNSVLTIPEDAFVFANTEAVIEIYGTIVTSLAKLKYILNNPNIHLASQVYYVINDIGDNTQFTLINYSNNLRNELINVNSIDELNVDNSRVGYKWLTGTPANGSFGIEIQCLTGKVSLGNFKLTFLGIPAEMDSQLKVFSDLFIAYGAELTISDLDFYYPTIYIGALTENCERAANFKVAGKIEVSGETASILLDHNGKLIIEETGVVKLTNKSYLLITDSDEIVVEVNGTLIVDSFEQIKGLNENQIKFGPKGKLVILNSVQSEEELISFPTEFRKSLLGKLMNRWVNNFEFHFTSFKGLKIDTLFEHYGIELKNWFGNNSLEESIRKKIVVWEDNAVLELDNKIIPWISEESNLYSIVRLFPSTGTGTSEKLQNLVNSFKSAGSGDIVFRFVTEEVKEIKLILKTPSIENAFYDGRTLNYYVKIKNPESYLFLANSLSNQQKEFILKRSNKKIPLLTTENYFNL